MIGLGLLSDEGYNDNKDSFDDQSVSSLLTHEDSLLLLLFHALTPRGQLYKHHPFQRTSKHHFEENGYDQATIENVQTKALKFITK